MKYVTWIVVIVVLVWAGWAIANRTPATDTPVAVDTSPITIGFVGPLTGDAANIGTNAKSAVEVAVGEVNAAGGVNGRPLNVIYEDGQCTGAIASNAASKLINSDKVSLILGGACSGETSAFTAMAEQAKVVVLSYCSSAPAITTAGDYIFRDYPSDSYQGSFAANYLYTSGKRKVAIVYVNSDWGAGIEKVFADKFKSLGGSVVAEEGYEQTSRDLRTQLTKAKSANPDVIYFLGYTEASVPAVKQMKDLGIKVPVFGGDAWDDSKIWSSVGAAGEGMMYVIPSAKPSDAFKASMMAKVGNNEIGVCSPTAYDAVKVIAQVMTKVGTDATAIKNELYKTSYTGGVSADPITFDSNGDLTTANYVIKVVHNGAAAELVAPAQ